MILWFALPLTLALYFMTRALYRHLPWPVINPVLIPTAVIIGLLLWLDLPLDQYQQGASPLTALLEPAVVALACRFTSRRARSATSSHPSWPVPSPRCSSRSAPPWGSAT